MIPGLPATPFQGTAEHGGDLPPDSSMPLGHQHAHAKPDREKVERWNRILRPYWGADDRKSWGQLAVSAFFFVFFWSLAYLSLQVGWWLTLLFVVPTAGFMMRLFMIQHDCGHGSFFTSRKLRDAVGFCIGVILLTPYQYWRKTHAYHHAHSGDLNFRGFGDVDTITVREYRSLPWLKRFYYRAYRHPLVLFGIGPAWVFLLKHRFPFDVPFKWKAAWRSVWYTNLAIVTVWGGLGLLLGFKAFLMVQLPVTMLASTLGVWMFYVQHQFEHTYWNWHHDWDFYDSALYGSSYLVLPRPLQWITAHIGVHHVHHMSSRIPNYKLQAVHDENPEFQVVTKVGFRDTWKLINLSLWDEESQKLVRFRDLKRLKAVA